MSNLFYFQSCFFFWTNLRSFVAPYCDERFGQTGKWFWKRFFSLFFVKIFLFIFLHCSLLNRNELIYNFLAGRTDHWTAVCPPQPLLSPGCPLLSQPPQRPLAASRNFLVLPVCPPRSSGLRRSPSVFVLRGHSVLWRRSIGTFPPLWAGPGAEEPVLVRFRPDGFYLTVRNSVCGAEARSAGNRDKGTEPFNPVRFGSVLQNSFWRWATVGPIHWVLMPCGPENWAGQFAKLCLDQSSSGKSSAAGELDSVSVR